MTEKNKRSKRGLSPILVTLILVVISLAAIFATYAWIKASLDDTADNSGVLLYKANVSFISGHPNYANVSIGNSGASDTQIVNVYLGTNPTNMSAYQISWYTAPGIRAGSVSTIRVMLNWNNGETYYFRIVPAHGAPVEFQEKAPA